MEKRDYLIIGIILIIVLTIFLSNVFMPKQQTIGEKYKDIYNSIDYNIKRIEDNMNAITVDGNWKQLKEINSNDEQLKNTYNLLLEDIKKCYLLYTDLENKIYDNLKILSFKNKEYITNNELEKLTKNESCLKYFNKYNDLDLSNNQESSEKIKGQISIIIDYKEEPYSYKTLDELLFDEAVTVSKIGALSSWLKVEYDSNK